jgi:hypothetical protein
MRAEKILVHLAVADENERRDGAAQIEQRMKMHQDS